jgi:hypothetical protein
VLDLYVLDDRFEPRSSQTDDYKTDVFAACSLGKHH